MRNLRLGLRVLALCGTTVLLLASAGSAQQPLWPNLRPKPAFQLLIRDPATGGKELRFSVTSYNWGLGPLELRAGETGSQGQNVYQRVYNDDGTHTDYFAGTFVWHPAHNHFHFGDYALYSLAPINAPGGSPKSGSKTTFCVMDTTKVAGSLPGAPQQAVYAVCGSTIQGMSVGWGDTYGYHLEGQSINITGNPSGDYCLTIQIDPKGKLCEADEPTDCGSSSDNTASSLVRIDVEHNTVTVLDNAGCAVGGEVVVASISPASAAPGSTIPVTITGSGFAAGTTLTFEGGSGPPPAAKNVVVVDENTVTADVTIKKGKPGKDPIWDVRVGSGILSNGFRVGRVRLHRTLRIVAAVGLLILIAAPPSPAQSPDLTTLQADVAKLKKDLEGVQRDLQEIKTLLRRAGAPEEFKSIVLGIGDGPFKGAPDARVTLVEFTDYQCPFCARHQKETVPQLLEKYVKTGKLKYVVRDFPLEAIHPAAVKAAEAPHCAGDGGKYWEMHERLFANPRAMAPADLVAHAQALGLDSKAFQACLEGGKYTPRVNQARAEGASAGVRGTPSFFLGITEPNSDKITAVAAIRGAHPFAKFQEEIETLLASPK